MASSSASEPKQASQPVIHFGLCELRLDTRELLLDGLPQPVRRRVFDLMAYLIAHGPRVVPHAELMRVVWQRTGGAAQMLARAVMEARRACGDPADDPKLFVSVHGVGYRFVGTVVAGPARPESGSPACADAFPRVIELLERAIAARDAGDLEQAQRLAERALADAGQSQSQTGRVRALAVCSSLALRRGTASSAAQLAAQALQIARGEGQAQLLALGEMAVGYVHLVAGDCATAIRRLEGCREALAVDGYQADLVRCLTLLALAFRRAGKHELGLRVCRSALAAARQNKIFRLVGYARSNEVMFLLQVGSQQAKQGLSQEARATYEEALGLVDALLNDTTPAGGLAERHVDLGNRASLLVNLGRLDEAWQMLAELEQALGPPGSDDSPVGARLGQQLMMLRATLLDSSGRYEEALEQVGRGVQAALSGGQHDTLPVWYGLAIDAARRSGQWQQALDWAQRLTAAQADQHASEASMLTCVLEAELNADQLQAELQMAREQNASLLQENAELRRRVASLDAAVAVSPTTGLADRQSLLAVFSSSHRHAIARGLPMCIGLLELVNAPELAAAQAAELLPTLLKRAAAVLRLHADIAPPAVEVGAGQVAFHIREAGLTRAAEVCNTVVEQLQRPHGVLAGAGLEPVWRCCAVDAAGAASVDDCVQRMAGRAAVGEDATARPPPPARTAMRASPAAKAADGTAQGGR